MARPSLLVGLSVIVWIPLFASAAEPTAAEIAILVEKLGSSKFAEREAASKQLAALDNVPPSLLKAVDSDNAEIARRAKAAVKTIQDRIADQRFQKELARINAEGLDLFIERMVRQPEYATEERWLTVQRLFDGMVLRAKKLGSVGFDQPLDSTKLPVRKELPQTAVFGSRLLLSSMPDIYNTISGSLVLSAGSFNRLTVVQRSVLFVIGDFEGCTGLDDSLIICSGKIGRVTRLC